MSQDIWNETCKRDYVRGLPCVTVLTAINETESKRYMVAHMGIEHRDPGSAIRGSVCIDMTPTQMRALAASLQAHAARVDQVLMPLLQPEPTIIPIALYREPETA